MTIKNAITNGQHKFTVSERRIQQVLLANYPAAGLSTVAALAGLASVSAPTVLRFCNKLGFGGFPSFQKALLNEVGQQFSSPLSMMQNQVPSKQSADLYRDTLNHLSETIRFAAQSIIPEEMDLIVDILSKERHPVHCIGGRFSAILARRMAMSLNLVRPNMHFIEGSGGLPFDILTDFNAKTVLIVFDFRRYQHDVMAFAKSASAAGARIILFTDHWRSPIAKFATHTITSGVETGAGLDTQVVALAHVEIIIAALTAQNPEKTFARLERIEDARHEMATALSNFSQGDQ